MTPSYGAKPTVLRCSRCGRFVDWEEARLQIVCGCRPRLDLPPVLVREARAEDRQAVLALFERDFGRTRLVAFHEEVDLDGVPAIVADVDEEIAGALAHRDRGDALHIVALATDPTWQRSGVGGHLVAEAELIARQRARRQVIVSTTNDNLPALYFYQRRGYRVTDVIVAAAAGSSAEPAVGFGGIPIRDEIHLIKDLVSSARA